MLPAPAPRGRRPRAQPPHLSPANCSHTPPLRVSFRSWSRSSENTRGCIFYLKEPRVAFCADGALWLFPSVSAKFLPSTKGGKSCWGTKASGQSPPPFHGAGLLWGCGGVGAGGAEGRACRWLRYPPHPDSRLQTPLITLLMSLCSQMRWFWLRSGAADCISHRSLHPRSNDLYQGTVLTFRLAPRSERRLGTWTSLFTCNDRHDVGSFFPSVFYTQLRLQA